MTNTTKRKPVVFEGTGSAIGNYFSAKPEDGRNWAAFDKKNKQHMQVLSLARTIGWTKKHDLYGKVADLEAIAQWLKSERSPIRKPLMEQTPIEVSTTIVAMGGIVISTFK